MHVSISVISLSVFPFFFAFAHAQVTVEADRGSECRVRGKRLDEDEEAFCLGISALLGVFRL